jgi:hypothetical protein
MAYCSSPTWYECGEPRWNDTDRGKPKTSEKDLSPVSLCPPQIPHGLNRAWTQASSVRDRRLTTWAMERLAKEMSPRAILDVNKRCMNLGKALTVIIVGGYGLDYRVSILSSCKYFLSIPVHSRP